MSYNEREKKERVSTAKQLQSLCIFSTEKKKKEEEAFYKTESNFVNWTIGVDGTKQKMH